jgi:hypothetical protein
MCYRLFLYQYDCSTLCKESYNIMIKALGEHSTLENENIICATIPLSYFSDVEHVNLSFIFM